MMLLTSILNMNKSPNTWKFETLPICNISRNIVAIPNRTDVKTAKPFLCRVASCKSPLDNVFAVEPEKFDWVGDTWCTPVEWDALTAL